MTTLPLFADPGDAPARERIRRVLGSTLFVEAGAGTGKTKALVDRVVALVEGGDGVAPVPLHAIAAITFTEKAANELRDRVRTALHERVDAPDADDAARDRCRTAIDDLDRAAICTLHSFAQRILTEFPVEAGLPPRIVVRDEISSRVAFESRWREFVDELLDDPEQESTVLVMLAAGVKLEQLRAVAEVLDDNWDLLDQIGPAPELGTLAVEPWLVAADAVCAHAASCRADDDTLVARLDEIAAYRDAIRDAFDDVERVQLLRAPKPSFRVGTSGRQGNWPDVKAVRAEVVRLGEARDAMVGALVDTAIRRAVARLAAATRAAVDARRVAGELEFHDLLVLARVLLRDPRAGAGARARLRDRYQRVLIDEFQDTDPIQVEIAALLGSGDPAASDRPWTDVAADPGRLFFVGDPKQSIYRFRRADIATFLAAAEHFADPAPDHLTCNFRTAPRVLQWINAVFSQLISAHPGSQPEYRALDAGRTVPPEHDREVVLLGCEPHEERLNAEELRRREAADVAAAIGSALGEQWPVYDTEARTWRSARLGDVCVLLPARTSLPFLEDALDDAGIAYRAESSSLVYASRHVRELLAVLRAVDDPSDELALVTALRSSVFGCGDDDLFEFRVEHGGRWDVRVAPPETLPADHPVAAALVFLGALHGDRAWKAPSELLERIVRDRHVLEVGATTGRFREVARRVRFLIDQARAFEDAVGGSLRDYLAWAELQGTEGARVVEAVVPETDDDAVRILTVHGAKGLEFPIVVCSGSTTAAQVAGRGVQVLFPPTGGCEVKLARGVQTAHFELHQPADEQMGFHEKLRLLYVACTRARDHLVVSVHRRRRELGDDRKSWTHAELLFDAAAVATYREFRRPEAVGAEAGSPAGVAAPAVVAPADPEVWRAERARAFERGRVRTFVAPTTLAHRAVPAVTADPGLAKEPRDLELPPWNKGRYGTAIGRAVHGTLQVVPLDGSGDLAAPVAAQAVAEGVLGHEDTIAALVRAALASATVQRAAKRPHWRETYVAVPFEGLTLEGYVDLVVRDDDGLVVVDYKTDSVDEATLATRIASYRIQAAGYALALAETTGERVGRAVLVFCRPEGPFEVEFAGTDLDDAIAEVGSLLAAERSDPSPIPAALPAEA